MEINRWKTRKNRWKQDLIGGNRRIMEESSQNKYEP